MERNQKKKRYHSKKNTVILTVSLFLLLIVNSCLGGLNDFITSCMFHYLENRTIKVGYLFDLQEGFQENNLDYDKVKSFLKSRKEVQACFDGDSVQVSQISFDGKNHDGNIYIEPFDTKVMTEYMEDSVTKLADNEVIVGRYTNFNKSGIADISIDTEIIDMLPYVGKTFTCYQDNSKGGTEYSFTIKGVFDNIKAGKPAVFYVNEHIHQKLYHNAPENIIIEHEDGSEEVVGYMIYFQVIVKNKNSVSVVEKEIRQEFPSVLLLHPVNYPDIVTYILTGMLLVGNFIIYFFVFNSVINVTYVTEDEVYKRRKEFGILRAIGYRDKDLRNILLKESMVSSGKAVVVSAFAGIVFFIIYHYIVQNRMNLYFAALSFSIKPYIFILYFLTAFGVPLIGFYFGYRKLKNLSIIDALRSE